MKPLLFLFGVVVSLSALPVQAQNVISPTQATVVAYWQVGDARTYKLTRTKTGQNAGSSTVLIDLKVLAATDTSYELECRYRDLHVLSGLPDDPKSMNVIAKVLKASEGLRVVVATSETGVLGEVKNIDEIERHCERILKDIADLASTRSERDELVAMFSKVITKEALELGAIEDIGRLLFPFGMEYVLKQEESGFVEVPNPLGGAPLPGTLKLTMTGLDPAQETATIETNHRIDVTGLPEWMKQLEERLGKTMTVEEREELDRIFREMRFTDDARFELSLTGAWVTRASWVRFFSSKEFEKRDERLYEQQ